ncbi:MAG: hypothetical protein N4A59_00575 [Marinifilum sp.]|nr:hypothetical protein [Marinifilum sp.]
MAKDLYNNNPNEEVTVNYYDNHDAAPPVAATVIIPPNGRSKIQSHHTVFLANYPNDISFGPFSVKTVLSQTGDDFELDPRYVMSRK